MEFYDDHKQAIQTGIRFPNQRLGGLYGSRFDDNPPEKTKILAESLIRWEMTVNEDTIDASVKTAKTLLLHLGYDPTWVEDKFASRFWKNLNKLNRHNPR